MGLDNRFYHDDKDAALPLIRPGCCIDFIKPGDPRSGFHGASYQPFILEHTGIDIGREWTTNAEVRQIAIGLIAYAASLALSGRSVFEVHGPRDGQHVWSLIQLFEAFGSLGYGLSGTG